MKKGDGEVEGTGLWRGWFLFCLYGISVNVTGLWHKLHRLLRSSSYQITWHLINLPFYCHQEILIHYRHPIICSLFAKCVSGILDFRYQMRCCVKAWGYCVAQNVKINLCCPFCWIIWASLPEPLQAEGIWYGLYTICWSSKSFGQMYDDAMIGRAAI